MGGISLKITYTINVLTNQSLQIIKIFASLFVLLQLSKCLLTTIATAASIPMRVKLKLFSPKHATFSFTEKETNSF